MNIVIWWWGGMNLRWGGTKNLVGESLLRGNVFWWGLMSNFSADGKRLFPFSPVEKSP